MGFFLALMNLVQPSHAYSSDAFDWRCSEIPIALMFGGRLWREGEGALREHFEGNGNGIGIGIV
jgi:hypothetical protein